MAYVPAYMGNVSKHVHDNGEILSEQVTQETSEMQVKEGFSGLWDINVTVKAEAPIERLTSLNHPVKINVSQD